MIVVLLGGWYLFFRAPAGAPTVQAPETSGETSSSNVTVAYSGEGFSLASATVPLGATVTFVNRSGDQMWVGSSMHPDHVSYDGTTRAEHCIAGYSGPAPFDQCAAGDTFSSVVGGNDRAIDTPRSVARFIPSTCPVMVPVPAWCSSGCSPQPDAAMTTTSPDRKQN